MMLLQQIHWVSLGYHFMKTPDSSSAQKQVSLKNIQTFSLTGCLTALTFVLQKEAFPVSEGHSLGWSMGSWSSSADVPHALSGFQQDTQRSDRGSREQLSSSSFLPADGFHSLPDKACVLFRAGKAPWLTGPLRLHPPTQ